MKIGDIEIGRRTLVIAEIGNNHEGDFNTAKMLVQKAAECGADAVKFQTIRAEGFVARSEENRFNQIKRYELSDAQFAELAGLAEKKGLLFLSTPFDFGSADMLEKLVPAFKISSGDLNWYQFLAHIARKGKPILLSTGMSDEDEIARALATIESASPLPLREQAVLLHCVSSYPVAITAANLLSIPYLDERFGVPVGYSDHTRGILACETAVALGARVIEKHFTYRKEDQAFRDHSLSADPADMKELVGNIRLIEASLGTKNITVTDAEQQNRPVMRRSLAAARDIPRGDVITEGVITFLRPGTGMPPEKLTSILGHRVKRDIAAGDIIQDEDIE